MDKLPKVLQYILDPNKYPENFITITEVSPELIQKLKNDHEQIQIRKHNAENQPFTFTNITDKKHIP